jgi:hypothetical protein
MRADIVPGVVFPDYEVSDHTAKRRKLSVIFTQSREGREAKLRIFLYIDFLSGLASLRETNHGPFDSTDLSLTETQMWLNSDLD